MKISILSKVENFVNQMLAKVHPPFRLEVVRNPKTTIIPVTTPIEHADGKDERNVEQKSESKIASQGRPAFSGSGYNAKGRVDNGKIRSNRKRR